MEGGISVSFQCAPLLFFSISRVLACHPVFNWIRAMQSVSGIQRVKLELATILAPSYETFPSTSSPSPIYDAGAFCTGAVSSV